jgi:lysophospholipase L1-like esterase
VRAVLIRVGAAGVVAALVLVGCARQSDPPTGAANLVWEGDSQSAEVPSLTSPSQVALGFLPKGTPLRTPATRGNKIADLELRAAGVDLLLDHPGTVLNLLVVWIGSNDLGEGAPPEQVEAALGAYTSARRKAGWHVVVLTVLPRSYPADVPGYEQRRLAYNDLLRQHLDDLADELVDVGALPQIGVDGDQLDPAVYTEDHTHLNSAGRQLVGEQVGPVLAGLVPAGPDRSVTPADTSG